MGGPPLLLLLPLLLLEDLPPAPAPAPELLLLLLPLLLPLLPPLYRWMHSRQSSSSAVRPAFSACSCTRRVVFSTFLGFVREYVRPTIELPAPEPAPIPLSPAETAAAPALELTPADEPAPAAASGPPSAGLRVKLSRAPERKVSTVVRTAVETEARCEDEGMRHGAKDAAAIIRSAVGQQQHRKSAAGQLTDSDSLWTLAPSGGFHVQHRCLHDLLNQPPQLLPLSLCTATSHAAGAAAERCLCSGGVVHVLELLFLCMVKKSANANAVSSRYRCYAILRDGIIALAANTPALRPFFAAGFAAPISPAALDAAGAAAPALASLARFAPTGNFGAAAGRGTAAADPPSAAAACARRPPTLN